MFRGALWRLVVHVVAGSRQSRVSAPEVGGCGPLQPGRCRAAGETGRRLSRAAMASQYRGDQAEKIVSYEAVGFLQRVNGALLFGLVAQDGDKVWSQSPLLR